MSAVFLESDVIVIGPQELDQVREMAGQAPLRRARLCLHRDPNCLVQEMVIALFDDSYVRPHRHRDKSESFHVIEGRLAVLLFDDTGRPTRSIELAPPGFGQASFYRLSSSLWHTAVPLSRCVIFHETTSGPFSKADTEYAEWAPDGENHAAASEYLKRVVSTK